MNSLLQNRSGLLRFALWGGCAAAIAIFAQRPVAPVPHEPAQQRPREAQNNRPVTPQDWERTTQFMMQNAPQRFQVFQSSREGPAKEKFREFLVNRLHRLEDLRNQTPKLYEVRVNEIRLDDQIFGICRQLKKASGTEKAQLQAQLRQKVAALFDNGIQERQIRISELQDRLKAQTQALEADTKKRDQLINQRFEQVASQGVPGARLNEGRSNEGRPKVQEAAPKQRAEREPGSE